MDLQERWDRICERLLADPPEPAPEVRAALRDVSSAAQGWETLVARSLVPPEWAASGDRSFVWCTTPLDGREGLRAYSSSGGATWALGSYPESVSFLERLASDPASVIAAEQLGREFARALGPWGVPPVTHVVWLEQTRPWYPHVAPLVEIGFAASEALGPDGPETWKLFRPGYDGPSFLARPGDDVGRALLWSTAVAKGALVPDGDDRGWPCGVAFSSLPDPWPPLLSLWEQGCVLRGISATAIELARLSF